MRISKISRFCIVSLVFLVVMFTPSPGHQILAQETPDVHISQQTADADRDFNPQTRSPKNPTRFTARLWWVLPASVIFSVIAIAAGISGALFFSPFFMIAVGLSPINAVSAGLITQLFGMIVGLVSYIRQRLVDFRIVKIQLIGAIPGVVGGAMLAHSVSGQLLHLIFGGGLLILAGMIFRSRRVEKRRYRILNVKRRRNRKIPAIIQN